MENDYNPFQGVLDLLGKKIEADAAAKQRQSWVEQSQAYGIDEYGRPYLRGAATGYTPIGSGGIVLIGAGVLAVALIFALKR